MVCCLILIRRLLAPNRPVKSGSNGSFMLRFNVAIPKKPAIRKMNIAHSLLFFSEPIRNTEMEIRSIGIIFCIVG